MGRLQEQCCFYPLTHFNRYKVMVNLYEELDNRAVIITYIVKSEYPGCIRLLLN